MDLTAIPGILYQIGMDGKLKYLGFLMKVLSANHMPRFLNLHSLVGIHIGQEVKVLEIQGQLPLAACK